MNTFCYHVWDVCKSCEVCPVAWAVEQLYGGIGMLHTLDAHRRCGFAGFVVRHLARQIIQVTIIAQPTLHDFRSSRRCLCALSFSLLHTHTHTHTHTCTHSHMPCTHTHSRFSVFRCYSMADRHFVSLFAKTMRPTRFFPAWGLR
jgi:hypothetical protein